MNHSIKRRERIDSWRKYVVAVIRPVNNGEGFEIRRVLSGEFEWLPEARKRLRSAPIVLFPEEVVIHRYYGGVATKGKIIRETAIVR